MTMSYDVSFTEEAIEDLSFLTIYEAQYTFSTERAQARVDELMESISSSLSAFPARIPEKPYGFTDTPRRKFLVGKYAAFYWVDDKTNTVYVEHILHSKADFSRIHFGN